MIFAVSSPWLHQLAWSLLSRADISVRVAQRHSSKKPTQSQVRVVAMLASSPMLVHPHHHSAVLVQDKLANSLVMLWMVQLWATGEVWVLPLPKVVFFPIPSYRWHSISNESLLKPRLEHSRLSTAPSLLKTSRLFTVSMLKLNTLPWTHVPNWTWSQPDR